MSPRVVVVTGGGGGIGAAIAEELGRQGAFVVTMDPLVSLDGAEQLPPPEETTAGRIVAAGGAARATSVSVTDAAAVDALFGELVAEFGRVDAVINVAGISRPTSFTRGSAEDWRAVLSVHLDGYRNVLAAALPRMAAAGYGRILGVTSGSGWRAADTGAYGCAKRAVAALTWQLGKQAPDGVVVNAMSPIAVTRMVTAALGKAPAGASAATGGLNLGSMPQPDELGPLAAHLVGDGFDWCSGEVIFAGGSEAAVVEPPRLLEVVRADMLRAAGAALVQAEATQRSGGGSNPRFSAGGAATDDAATAEAVRACAVVSDRPEVADAVAVALKERGVACTTIATPAEIGDADAVVLALDSGAEYLAPTAWERTLAEHTGIVEGVFADAMWARAVADLARPVRLLTLTDATTAGGSSRAQASAQLARTARKATGDNVAAFAVADEGAGERDLGDLAAYLLCDADAALAGAELVAGPGWVGVRSHPQPGACFVLGDATIPDWFDATLRSVIG